MDYFLKSIIEIVDILSFSPEQQLNYLKEIGDVPVDELALEYDDLSILLIHNYKSNIINKKQYLLLFKLEKKLNDMSNNKELWTKNALKNSLEWSEVRELAIDCKKTFQELQKKGGHTII